MPVKTLGRLPGYGSPVFSTTIVLRHAKTAIFCGFSTRAKRQLSKLGLIEGHTVLFTSAGQLLGDLAALDSDAALRRRLRHYARPEFAVSRHIWVSGHAVSG